MNWYKEALSIFAENKINYTARDRIILDYAQRHPADFVRAANPSPDFVDECRRLYLDEGKKIYAIKLWRECTGASLKDARAAVEDLA